MVSHHHGAMVPFFTARFDTQRRNFHEGKNGFLSNIGTHGVVGSVNPQSKCRIGLDLSIYALVLFFSLLQEDGSLAFGGFSLVGRPFLRHHA